MENKELNQLQKDVIDVLSNICESVNETDYRDDITSIATMDMNNSGSYTCNRYEAKKSLLEYQGEYSYLIAKIDEAYEVEYGMNISAEYFKDPEKFQVLLLMEVVPAVLYNSEKFTDWMNEADKVGDINALESIVSGIVSDIEIGNIDFNDLF